MSSPSRFVLLAVITTAGLVGLALPVPAGAGTDTIEWSGTCDEVVFGTELPAEQIDPYIPDYFTIRTDSRSGVDGETTALFFVSTVSCWNVVIEGKASEPFHESAATVDIESPEACTRIRDESKDSCPGGQLYSFWSVHDSTALRTALVPHGQSCPQGPCRADVRFEGGLNPLGGPSTAGADVTWGYSGDHSIDGVTGPPTVPLSDDTFDDNGGGWFLGPKGPVRRAFLLSPLDLQAGAATLTTEPGSLLADMVGGTTTPGFALIASFDFQAKSQVAS